MKRAISTVALCWAVAAALRRGVTSAQIASLSGIDPYFLAKIEDLVTMERQLLGNQLRPNRCGHADIVLYELGENRLLSGSQVHNKQVVSTLIFRVLTLG